MNNRAEVEKSTDIWQFDTDIVVEVLDFDNNAYFGPFYIPITLFKQA